MQFLFCDQETQVYDLKVHYESILFFKFIHNSTKIIIVTIQIVPLTLFTLDKQKQHYEHNKLEYTNTMNMRNMTSTTKLCEQTCHGDKARDNKARWQQQCRRNMVQIRKHKMTFQKPMRLE
jgi:hypothetical protein